MNDEMFPSDDPAIGIDVEDDFDTLAGTQGSLGTIP
jgi:hypothetical protein